MFETSWISNIYSALQTVLSASKNVLFRKRKLSCNFMVNIELSMKKCNFKRLVDAIFWNMNETCSDIKVTLETSKVFESYQKDFDPNRVIILDVFYFYDDWKERVQLCLNKLISKYSKYVQSSHLKFFHSTFSKLLRHLNIQFYYW